MSGAQTVKDLRAAPRVPVNLTARYRSGSIVLHGTAVNLSVQGMFFTLDDVTPIFDEDPESEVLLELDLLGHTLAAKGEVCWIDGARAGLGIRFTEIAPEDRARLAALLAAGDDSPQR